MEKEETKKIKYEKPELVEFKWMDSMGLCNDGSSDSTCKNGGSALSCGVGGGG